MPFLYVTSVLPELMLGPSQQPMLQELGKQNPALLGLINENQADFLHLINEAGSEGGEG